MLSSRNLLVAITALVAMLLTPTAHAQVELSRADRLAILYTPQLQFAPSGEPLVKIGIAEDIPSIRFSANTAVTVMPLGEGGSEIRVPADTEFEVELLDGTAGTYNYAVVVAQFMPSERDAVAPARARWEARGFEVSARQVGSIFAVSGQRFDTRKTLLTVGSTGDRAEARALADRLTVEFGIDARVHSELDEYPGGTVRLSGLPGGTVISNRDLLWVRGDDDTEFTIEDVPYDRWMGGDQMETRRYVGALIFTADRDGDLSVVNELTIERLVEGILPAELYGDSPDEAMRAQAVAARSELLADLGVRHLADPYMTCSDQRCQVYRGVGYERTRESRAAADTRGEVLSHGDQVIKAYFSSNNGGFSASNMWTWDEEQRPYLMWHVDGDEPDARWIDGLNDEAEVRAFLEERPDGYSDIARASNTFRWNRSSNGQDLSLAVAERYDGLGPLTDLEVLERAPSGRVARLRIAGTRGEVIVERELNVRFALGGDRPLRSALFVMDIEHAADGIIEAVRFSGGGFGHGVGLCQSGAVGMADRGYTYRQILENYYPGTDLRVLY